jgi:hypothetical protein
LGVGNKLIRFGSRRLWPLSSVGPLGLSHALGELVARSRATEIDLSYSSPLSTFSPSGHAFGATYAIPHGMCSCLTLGATVRHLSSHLSGNDLDYLSMAIAFIPRQFLPPNESSERYTIEDVQGMSVEEKRRVAGTVGRSIGVFLKSIGLETRLSEWEVPQQDLEGIGNAIVDRLGGVRYG